MHPWFTNFKSDEVNHCEDLEDSLIKRLKEYRGVSHLKRAAINILVKMCNEEEMKPITDYFKKVDIDGTGLININELT